VRRGFPVLLGAAALAACGTARSPLEDAARNPAPISREAFGANAPSVFPDPAAKSVEATLAEAAGLGSVSLEHCVRLALAVHEDLVSGDEDRLQAWLQRDLSLSAILPDVRMLLRHDRQDPVSLGSGGGVVSTEPARTQWSINVIQPLFQGFREFHAMRSAERTADALAARRDDLRRALATSVARAFYLALESEAEIRAQEEALHLDEARVEEMTARVAEGLARRTEVLLQESRRETTRAALLLVRERRDASRILLDSLVGIRLTLPLADATPPPGVAPAREEALAEARAHRPDVREARRRMEAAEEDLKFASGQRWPLVQATGNWYLDRWNYSAFADETRWDASVFLDLPLFLGGEIGTRERIAESRIRQAALEGSRVLRNVVREVDDALVRLQAGLERLSTLQANERFARENLALLQEEYRQGLATNLEVFTAQIQLQEAAVNLERQQYQSRLDRVELSLVMGRDDHVGVPPPTEEAP
jgi:outer membrane protein